MPWRVQASPAAPLAERVVLNDSHRRTDLGGPGDPTPAPGHYDTHGGVGKKEAWSERASSPTMPIGTAKRKTLEGIASPGGGPNVGPGSYATRGKHHRLAPDILPGELTKLLSAKQQLLNGQPPQEPAPPLSEALMPSPPAYQGTSPSPSRAMEAASSTNLVS